MRLSGDVFTWKALFHQGPVPTRSEVLALRRHARIIQICTYSSNCFSAWRKYLPSVKRYAPFGVMTAHPEEASHSCCEYVAQEETEAEEAYAPADPLKPEMKARRSSHLAMYSLKSGKDQCRSHANPEAAWKTGYLR